jgi:APA family basic amino acid/polyamine antiporter
MELKRTLGFFDATAIGIGAIIGAGIFVVLGVAIGYAGPAVIVSMVIAGTVALFSALSFAELSSAIPKEGGTYQFAYEMIHPSVGFVSGCLWLMAQTVAGTAISLGLASYLALYVPTLSVKEIAVSAALVLTVLNIVGLRYSAIANNVLVLTKIAILCLFLVTGIFQINSQNYAQFAPHGFFGILQGAGFIFFAYLGFGRIAALGEEVKNPKKTLPLSILVALAICASLYVLTGFVATGIINYTKLANSGSPIADAARATGNSVLTAAVSLGAVVATVSVLLTNLLGLSRVSFAIARNGQFPNSLARVHSRFGTPYISILLTGTVMTALTLVLNLPQSAAITSFSMLTTHIFLHASAIRLRKKIPNLKTFKAPVYPLIPCLGLASCLVLMFSLPFISWIITIAAVLLSLLYYSLNKRLPLRLMKFLFQFIFKRLQLPVTCKLYPSVEPDFQAQICQKQVELLSGHFLQVA